jgi:hypothetical protein
MTFSLSSLRRGDRAGDPAFVRTGERVGEERVGERGMRDGEGFGGEAGLAGEDLGGDWEGKRNISSWGW